MEIIPTDMITGMVIGMVGTLLYLKIKIMLKEPSFMTWKETQLDLNEAKREVIEYKHKLEIERLNFQYELDKLKKENLDKRTAEFMQEGLSKEQAEIKAREFVESLHELKS